MLLRDVVKAFVQRKHKDICCPSEKHKETHLVVLSKRLVASKKTCRDFCFSFFSFFLFFQTLDSSHVPTSTPPCG